MNIRIFYSTKVITVALIILAPFVTIPIVVEKNVLASSFGNIINVSNTGEGDSSVPQVAAEGANVYVVWEDDNSGNNEILFARSTDSATSFSDPVSMSNSPLDAFDPQVAISEDGEQIYVVWSQEGEIFFSSSTDNGTSFDNPINVSNSGNQSLAPQLAVSGNTLYVAWEEQVSGTLQDIYIAVSDSAGTSFNDPINVSNDNLQSSSVEMSTADGIVYIVWKDFDASNFVGDIFFVSSSDGGQTFGDPINLSGFLGGDAFFPQISVAGQNLYVIWGDAINLDAFLAASTDGGQTFTGPINLSNSGFVFNANPAVLAFANGAYAVWQDEISGSADIFFSTVPSGGDSVGSPIDISVSNTTTSFNPRVATSGTNKDTIYVIWQETSPSDVFVAISTDGGGSFGDPVNISSSDSVGLSALSQFAVSGNDLHLVWEDSSSGGQFDIFSRSIIDSGPPSVTIDSVGDVSPRWGVDSVDLSGTVNGDSTDTISIEWGDGSSDTGIALSGSSWGPISHTYDSSNTGTKEIEVTLLDEADTLKASASTEVQVQKHLTTLFLDVIMSVIQGSDIAVNGVLQDFDANLPVEGRTIDFVGTGVTGDLSSVSTLADGTYSSSGASPNVVNNEPLTVQAQFSGDSAYESSSSDIVGYDTVANGTAEFVVPAGTPSGPIDLLGFNSTITFDSVLSSGSIFVSTCDAPSSTRYIEIPGMCLRISPALELGDDSAAHITVSYSDQLIPDGYSENDVDLFHDGVAGIVDISESRNTEDNTVTGRTAEFSRFIGGVALHTDAPVGAVRHQIFVGDNNDLVFEFPETRHTDLSTHELTFGDTNTVTITDPYANVNGGNIDGIKVTITSSSDPIGIIVTFQETDLDTGIFEGSFTLTTGSSSDHDSLLEASLGDEIMASYDAPGMAPFRAIVSGVIEAGFAEVAGFGVPSLFNAPVDAYEMRLIDARLSPDANVTVIMSYHNFSGVSDPLQLGVALIDGTSCLDVLSSSTLDSLDIAAETITGYAKAVGQFVLVLDDHIPADQECVALGFPPAGGGGGIPRPGTGIILLDSAVVAKSDSEQSQRDRSSGGGGGGGSRSAGITNIPSGNDVQITITTTSGRPITLEFYSVESGGGQIKVETNRLATFEDKLEVVHLAEDNDQHGLATMAGVTYSTVGEIYDVDASDVKFSGAVDVTIPYDESAAQLLASGSESEVRLLHYNEDAGVWEDNTLSVDETANTVTGRLDSLSPVVAAVILKTDETADSWKQLELSNLTLDDSDGKVTLSANVQNIRGVATDYVLVVQILDENNVVQQIDWQQGSLPATETDAISISLDRSVGDTDTVEVFLWTELQNPSLLAESVQTRM